jgi:hypothetical protein
MGVKFSSEAGDAQALIRDKDGRLKVMSGSMDESRRCNPLPIPMNSLKLAEGEQAVQYLFLPSTNYQGKNFHAHTYYDNDCDTPANDDMNTETVLGNKNVNHVRQTYNSNSGFFDFNENAVNRPLYPIFTPKDGIPRKGKKKAFSECTLIPYPPNKENPVTLFHNTMSVKMYTEDSCENEYVNILDPPRNLGDKQNIDNRDNPINDQTFSVRESNVKSHMAHPAFTTNAKYYKMFS